MTTIAQPSKTLQATTKLVFLALLTSMSVMLQFFGLNLPYVNITLAFLPIAMAAMLYGPVAGASVGFLSNELDAILHGFAFNPLYSLVHLGKGLIYGFVLYRKEPKRSHIVIGQIAIDVFLHIGLNSLLLYLFYNKATLGALPIRILKNVMFFPVEVFLIILMSHYRPQFIRMTK